MAEMNMRERMLAYIQGREHDRVSFVQYSDCGGPDNDVWSLIGRNNMGILRWSSVHRFERPHCRIETEEFQRGGREGMRTTIHTKVGDITEEKLLEPVFDSAHTVEHFVKEPDDYQVLMEFLHDTVVVEDFELLEQNMHKLGDDGLPHTDVGRTPFQQLWVEWVSIENLCLHMIDYPELMNDVITLLADITRKIFPIVRKSPVPYIVFSDNITAPIIGEKYFRQYCVPLYNELADMLDESGVPVFVHMDGDLKPLWEAIGESGVRGIDSLTPPPDNDTSVADAAAMWPEMRLGVNFPSSVHLAPPEKIYEAAMQILEEGGHTGRLQIQISENVPPNVWRKSYPEIVRAINDFGKP